MRKKFQEIFGKTDGVLRRYPLVLVMALLGAVFLIAMSQENQDKQTEFIFAKYALICTLGISLTFGLNMLSERIGKVIPLQIAGVLFLAIFYYILPEKEQDFTEVYAFLLIPIFILSHLLVSFIAFFGKKIELNFWQYNKNLFINIFLTGVFTGVLIGGVQLAIVAVDQLFDFNFQDGYYRNPFIFLSVFGSCFIFLLFNVEGLKKLEKDSNYPQILKFFTQYILIPLLLIYATILYFYSGKILINWELPRGWVSYLILAYSVVGILAILLVHPLKEEASKSWVKVFSKIFYFTLIPLLLLLFTSIFTRILEYGYTEPRYFVLILALWLASVVIYFILKKNGTIKFIPVSLFIFGLFALIFPYLNAFSVAKRSQNTELKKILKDENLLKEGKINFEAKIPSQVSAEIADKFKFLAERKETDLLLNLLQKNQQIKFSNNVEKGDFFGIQKLIGSNFKNTYYSPAIIDASTTQTTTLLVKNFSIPISEYQYLFKADRYNKNIFQFDSNTLELNIPQNNFSSEISLTYNGTKINLKNDLERLFKLYPAQGEIEVDNLFIDKKINNYEFKILLDSVIRSREPNGKISYWINSDSVLILVKKN